MKNIVSIITASAILLAAPMQEVHAQDIESYTPTGPWTADFGEDYCRLVREFGNGSKTISLALERIQPGASMRALLVGESLKAFRGSNTIGYSFGPGGAGASTGFATSKTATGDTLMVLGAMTLAGQPAMGPQAAVYDPAAERKVAEATTSLRLTEGLVDPVELKTGAMGDVFEVLNTCTDDLVTYWGLDAQKHHDLQRRASVVPGATLPNGIVPFGEFGKLAAGYNQLRIMVGADGSVQSCHVHQPTLSEALNAKICEEVPKNVRFEPALDASGQAIASYFVTPVMMLLPAPGGRRR